MLYHILKLESSDKNHPRGTGEDILVNMEHPIAKTILDYREVAKLLNTFVDKLPKMVNPVDGRIHASFNACGTVTGRLSSSNPNCQQIPSRGPGKEVRNMFRATISKDVEIKNSENSFVVNLYSRIPTDRGYLYLDELKVGDKLILEDSEKEVKVNVTKIESETGSIYYDFE